MVIHRTHLTHGRAVPDDTSMQDVSSERLCEDLGRERESKSLRWCQQVTPVVCWGRLTEGAAAVGRGDLKVERGRIMGSVSLVGGVWRRAIKHTISVLELP